jgi:hypothetical protein
MRHHGQGAYDQYGLCTAQFQNAGPCLDGLPETDIIRNEETRAGGLHRTPKRVGGEGLMRAQADSRLRRNSDGNRSVQLILSEALPAVWLGSERS